jgi:hypothetical protein
MWYPSAPQATVFYMKADTRRAVAYIAGRAISGKTASSVYDYGEGGHHSFSGDVSAVAANVYDYGSSCHVGGQLGSLYHYGHGSHLQLTLKGKSFTGYDYDDASDFSGDVHGSSVTVYDYPTGTAPPVLPLSIT